MTGPRRSSGDSSSFVGLLVAVALLLCGGLFVADRAGFDVGGLLPETSATSSGGDRGGDARDRDRKPGKIVFRDVVDGTKVMDPDVPMDPRTMRFLEDVAAIYGDTMVVSSGSGGEHGDGSDHYEGWAADFGMPTNDEVNGGPKGDRMMRACLIRAGDSEATAERLAKTGGLETRRPKGFRVQCIWKVKDHFNHVHIGAKPTG